MAELNHDDITRMLSQQISEGIAKIDTANTDVLLVEDESGAAKVRDIDKAFKDEKVEDADALKFWAKAEKARATYKEALEAARNTYRVNVLGEEAVTDSPDEDAKKQLKEEMKEVRQLVMEALGLLKTYAGTNKKTDVVAWADSLEIPQVGRQGTSNVGQKKPRAYVSVNGTQHESFGEAAKAASVLLSTEDNKVAVTSSDLVSAYTDAGSTENFEFQGLAVKVTPKTSAKETADKAA